jgi:hypothetical protein
MLAEVFRWLLTPISGASDHAISRPLAWHGRLMVLAMGLLTPPLIIVAAPGGTSSAPLLRLPWLSS